MELSASSGLAAQMANLMMRTPGVKEACGLMRPIVSLLAEGEPITMDRLASSTGLPSGKLKAVLERSPHAEWADDGRLEGFGLTLRPTPHSLHVNGSDLYVWTGADAFVSAILLDRAVRIGSSCQVTGVPIRIDVVPSGVRNVEPSTTVLMAISHPERHGQLSWLDASRQVFFRSLQAASPWMVKNRGYDVLDMHQAFEYSRQLAALL